MLDIAGIIILGILAQWIAWRLKVPSILPLILFGLLVGPISTLWTGEEKLLEPIWNGQKGIFPGEYLFHFVELAIGVILFEGGLSLKREEVREVGPTIIKLITLGSLVTFLGGTLLVHYIMDLSWSVSFLFAGLIIVTGPTVISPILRNLPLKRNVSTVLKWEGILIDPIGALVAVLVFEFIMISYEGGGSFTIPALQQFLLVLFIGSSLGFFAAYFLKFLLKKDWIPHYLLTVFTLAYVLFTFVLSHFIVHDSGLLTVVVLGMVIGNIDVPHKNDIIYFGESISILLIAVLFILLSANINISDLELLFNLQSIILFLAVILLLRPLGVFLSTYNSTLSGKEKMFVSWVGPRGIVAAGIASLFGLKLSNLGIQGAEYITPLVFMIVLGTVILNATTAGMVAKWLDVLLAKSNGVLIVGAHKAARLIGDYLKKNEVHVVLIDSNSTSVDKANHIGLEAFTANIYADNLVDFDQVSDIGYMMAMTGSAEVNEYALREYGKTLGENGAYSLVSVNELQHPESLQVPRLFSKNDDFINLLEIARDFPQIHEVQINSEEDFKTKLDLIDSAKFSVPLFIKESQSDELKIILTDAEAISASEGDLLVYLGKDLFSEQSAA